MEWIEANLDWLRWAMLAGALVIILPLAAYAWQLRRQILQRQTTLDNVGVKGRDNAIRSSKILAKSMLEDDLNVTEGAIRIKVMLDYLLPCSDRPGPYPGIYALFEAAEHLARGPAYRELKPAERLRQDLQREPLEAQYREQVLAEARLLRDADFGDGKP